MMQRVDGDHASQASHDARGWHKEPDSSKRKRPVCPRFVPRFVPVSFVPVSFRFVDSAKQQETKTRRLQEGIGLLAAGERLGLK